MLWVFGTLGSDTGFWASDKSKICIDIVEAEHQQCNSKQNYALLNSLEPLSTENLSPGSDLKLLGFFLDDSATP